MVIQVYWILPIALMAIIGASVNGQTFSSNEKTVQKRLLRRKYGKNGAKSKASWQRDYSKKSASKLPKSSKQSKSSKCSKSKASKSFLRNDCTSTTIQPEAPSLNQGYITLDPSAGPVSNGNSSLYPSASPLTTNAPTIKTTISSGMSSTENVTESEPPTQTVEIVDHEPSIAPIHHEVPSTGIFNVSIEPTTNTTNGTVVPKEVIETPLQVDVGTSYSSVQFQVCKCDIFNLCRDEPLTEADKLRICTFMNQPSGVAMTPSIEQLEIIAIGFEYNLIIIVNGTAVYDQSEQHCDELQHVCSVSTSLDDLFQLPQLPPSVMVNGTVSTTFPLVNSSESMSASMTFERIVNLEKVTTFSVVDRAEEDDQPKTVSVRRMSLVFAGYFSMMAVTWFVWLGLIRNGPTNTNEDDDRPDDESI